MYREAPVTFATPSLRGTFLPTDFSDERRVASDERELRLRFLSPVTCRSSLLSARAGGGEGLVQDFQGLANIGFCDVQGGGNAEDVALEAALADQESPLLGFLKNAVGQRLLGRAVPNRLVHDELDSQHQPQASHVPDVLREPPLDFQKP